MKIITDHQIKMILDELVKLNIPVQSYAAMQDILSGLPATEKPEAK